MPNRENFDKATQRGKMVVTHVAQKFEEPSYKASGKAAEKLQQMQARQQFGTKNNVDGSRKVNHSTSKYK
ncbi:MAG TPA: hypothetical protein VIF60_02605 [Burkholderiaceae bacterium]|jgi:hypothetical protein